MLRWILPVAVLVVAVSGCTKVLDEERIDAVIQRGVNAGEAYTIRIRTIQGPQGTFVHTSVLYGGRSATCNLDRARDCEIAAEALIERADFGNLGRSL